MERLQQLSETGLFGAAVPRYTSYPTTPHFNTEAGADEARAWMGALGPDNTVSLYVHIPFCERLCWFCACRTQGVRSPEPVARYVETLKQEIALTADALSGRPRVVRIHWGGGTPTILGPDQVHELSGAIRAAFNLDPVLEFSVEIDPTLVDEDKVAALSANGMNRASIGIQDFSPKIQEAIGRPQSFERTQAVVEMLRAAGIHSLNTDVVYGLPHQTMARIAASTDKVLSLDPDRIALFGYAHVPWVAKRQRMIDPDALPDPLSRLGLLEEAEARIVDAGYQALGIDHFARPADSLAAAARAGQLRRNFQGYTDDRADALIGMGASSISRYPQGYLQNAPATATYAGLVRSGTLPATRGFAMRREDHIRAALIERFLCDLALDPARLEAEWPGAGRIVARDLDRVRAQYRDWLDWTDGRMVLKPEGKPLARLIAAEFDTFFRAEAARHSHAI